MATRPLSIVFRIGQTTRHADVDPKSAPDILGLKGQGFTAQWDNRPAQGLRLKELQ
jgi:hypothetical protein